MEGSPYVWDYLNPQPPFYGEGSMVTPILQKQKLRREDQLDQGDTDCKWRELEFSLRQARPPSLSFDLEPHCYITTLAPKSLSSVLGIFSHYFIHIKMADLQTDSPKYSSVSPV